MYQSILSPTEGIYKEKGSKFLAFAYPVETEEEVKSYLEVLKKKYFDATHHCYAYILGAKQEKWRANDDGEPNHSAGTPILNQIKAKNISDVFVVVVRYFGGVKLGVSGLVNAYKTAAALVLDEAILLTKIPKKNIAIRYTYPETKEVMHIIHQYDIQIINQEFDLFCQLQLGIPSEKLNIVTEKLAKWIYQS
ncbi:MAG: YigZ family protein [Thermonemataceae bacterium]|nr:YigZ family protein [Thermonemataceae bacterium]